MHLPAPALEFASFAPRSSRLRLEELLYFNPHQHLVRQGILGSLASFGQPSITETSSGLSVCVAREDTQALFAFDRRRAPAAPVGVVIYLRASRSEITIVHLAIHSEYVLQAAHSHLGLGIALVERIRAIAARIVGVTQLTFSYRRQMTLRVSPTRPSETPHFAG